MKVEVKKSECFRVHNSIRDGDIAGTYGWLSVDNHGDDGANVYWIRRSHGYIIYHSL